MIITIIPTYSNHFWLATSPIWGSGRPAIRTCSSLQQWQLRHIEIFDAQMLRTWSAVSLRHVVQAWGLSSRLRSFLHRSCSRYIYII